MLIDRSSRARQSVILASHQTEVLQFEVFDLLLYSGMGLLEAARDLPLHCGEILSGEHAFADQALAILLRHGGMFLDFAIENGLRVAGIVAFVMSVPTVAIHVDHHVFTERLPVIEG